MRVLAAEIQRLGNRQRRRRCVRPDVFDLRAIADRHAAVERLELRVLEPRLQEVGVAADAGEVDRGGEALARVREDRVVDRVVDEARRDLADRALAALTQQQRIAQVRVALHQLRRVVDRIEIRDLDGFVAVGDEHAREAGEREPAREVAAGRFLRELIDVAQRALVDVDAAGDIAIEQERLRERELVVLRPRPDLQRHRERLAAAEEVRGLERQLAEEALELRHAGAERQLVAVLLLELQRDVDLVLLAGRLLDVDALPFFERLEVAQLIEALDAVLERLGVERRRLRTGAPRGE